MFLKVVLIFFPSRALLLLLELLSSNTLSAPSTHDRALKDFVTSIDFLVRGNIILRTSKTKIFLKNDLTFFNCFYSFKITIG